MMREAEAIYRIDVDGWGSNIARLESPNYDERPRNESIRLIVVHAISLPPGSFGSEHVADFFTNCLDPKLHPYFETIATQRVSAHFFIRRAGGIVQFVSCLHRAWHAGISCWHGRERCNDFSIGIELEGDDATAFTAEQYSALAALILALRAQYPIEEILGHADIAPARKTDPGPYFDWYRVAVVA